MADVHKCPELKIILKRLKSWEVSSSTLENYKSNNLKQKKRDISPDLFQSSNSSSSSRNSINGIFLTPSWSGSSFSVMSPSTNKRQKTLSESSSDSSSEMPNLHSQVSPKKCDVDSSKAAYPVALQKAEPHFVRPVKSDSKKKKVPACLMGYKKRRVAKRIVADVPRKRRNTVDVRQDICIYSNSDQTETELPPEPKQPPPKKRIITRSRRHTVDVRKVAFDSDSDEPLVKSSSKPTASKSEISTRSTRRSSMVLEPKEASKKKPITAKTRKELECDLHLSSWSSSEEELRNVVVDWNPKEAQPSMPSLTESAKQSLSKVSAPPKTTPNRPPSAAILLDEICRLTPSPTAATTVSKPATAVPNFTMHVIDDTCNRIPYVPNTNLVGNFSINPVAIKKRSRAPNRPRRRFESTGTQTEISIEVILSTIKQIQNYEAAVKFPTKIRPGSGSASSVVSMDVTRVNFQQDFFTHLMVAANQKMRQRKRPKMTNARRQSAVQQSREKWRNRLAKQNNSEASSIDPKFENWTAVQEQPSMSNGFGDQILFSSTMMPQMAGIEPLAGVRKMSPPSAFQQNFNNGSFFFQLENTVDCVTNCIPRSTTDGFTEYSTEYSTEQHNGMSYEYSLVETNTMDHTTTIMSETKPTSYDQDNVDDKVELSLPSEVVVSEPPSEIKKSPAATSKLTKKKKKRSRFLNPFAKAKMMMNPMAVRREKIVTPPRPCQPLGEVQLNTPHQKRYANSGAQSVAVNRNNLLEPNKKTADLTTEENPDMDFNKFFGIVDMLGEDLDINNIPIEGFPHIPMPDASLLFSHSKEQVQVEKPTTKQVKIPELASDDDGDLCIDEDYVEKEADDGGKAQGSEVPIEKETVQATEVSMTAGELQGDEPILVEENPVPAATEPEPKTIEKPKDAIDEDKLLMDHGDSDLDYEDDCLALTASPMDMAIDAEEEESVTEPIKAVLAANSDLQPKDPRKTAENGSTDNEETNPPVNRPPIKKFDMNELKKIRRTITNEVKAPQVVKVVEQARQSVLNYYPEERATNGNVRNPRFALPAHRAPTFVRPTPQQQQQRFEEEKELFGLNLFGPPIRKVHAMAISQPMKVLRANLMPQAVNNQVAVNDSGLFEESEEDLRRELELFAEATGLGVSNDMPEPPPPSPPQIAQESPVPLVTSTETQLGPGIKSDLYQIFDFPCNAYLLEKCTAGPACPNNHLLPDDYRVKNNLFKLSHEHLVLSYTFVEEHPILFNKYFRLYCEVFGRRKMRQQLIRMIPDVEKPHRDVFYYHHLVEGLMFSDLLRPLAVGMIIEHHKQKVFKTIDVLIELICECDGDAPQFMETLVYFASVPEYQIQNRSIERLLTISLKTKNCGLIQFLVVQLRQATVEKLQSANKELIMDFLMNVNEMNVLQDFSGEMTSIFEKLP